MTSLSVDRASGCQTLERGLDIIDSLTGGPMRMGELSTRLGLARGASHRLAAALVGRGVLTYAPRSGYTLGPKLLEWAERAREQRPLTTVARPWLEDLSRQTRDTVNLGVTEVGRAVCIDRIHGRRPVIVESGLGEEFSMTRSALGMALVLATPDRWSAWFSDDRPEASDKARRSWLDRMRTHARAGYTTAMATTDRIRCIAAPVRRHDGATIAAISVSAASRDLADARVALVGAATVAVADAISADLGWPRQPLLASLSDQDRRARSRTPIRPPH